MARRGSYAKGVAKREEILERALEVIAREGYRGASVKELAEAVGLSQAGLLHYFDSKEELFTEILRKRDELDAVHYGPFDASEVRLSAVRAGLRRVMQHNGDVPGVVQLFSRLSVDGADPQHPAHEYFLARSEQLREGFTTLFAQQQADGELTTAVAPETFARIVQAVADGIQLQWMMDPSFDMADTVDALFDAVMPPVRPAADTDLQDTEAGHGAS